MRGPSRGTHALVLGAVVFAALTATGPATAPSANAGVSSSPPNVVLIVTDDQRFDTIGRCLNGYDPDDYAAGPDACMPNLQSLLMANGSTFRRGYVTSSLCCPSRATLLTGQYARHNGVVDNFTGDILDDARTLPVWLDDAGYRTGLYGKYLNRYGNSSIPKWPSGYVPPGWDSFHAINGLPYSQLDYRLAERDPGETATIQNYKVEPGEPTAACAAGNDYSVDRLCDLALDFLAEPSADPFFLYFAPLSPHSPYQPPPRWLSYANQVSIPTVPSINVIPSPDPPYWMERHPMKADELAEVATEARLQLAMSRAIDDAIGRFHAELTANGKLENTVWVFLSDNGFARGHHRWTRKDCELEECHRVPLVVACPAAVCPGAVGGQVVEDALALNLDVAPTIVELAGATPTVPLDGRSLLPLLTDPAAPWRGEFVMEDDALETMGITAWRSDGHLWSYATLPVSEREELYDLTEDPWQLTNRWKDPAHAATLQDMRDLLAGLITAPAVTFTQSPPATTSDTTADFAWTSSEAADFSCALDGAVPAPCGSGTSGSASFASLATGPHRFQVSGIDPEHNPGQRQVHTWTVGGGGVPPTVTLTKPAATAMVSDTTVQVMWASSDDIGMARNDVYERLGPSGTASLVASTTGTTYTRTGMQGTTYCYQVAAVDVDGNSTTSSMGCAAVPRDDVALQPVGKVDRLIQLQTFVNTATRLNAAGEELRATVTGRRLGVLVKRTPTSGKLQLWVDGVKVATLDLYTTSVTTRVYLGARSLSPGPHTVRLVWDGTKNAKSTGKAVLIEGLGVVA